MPRGQGKYGCAARDSNPEPRIKKELSRWRAFCMALPPRFLAGYASVTGMVQFRRAGAGGCNPCMCPGVVVGRLPPLGALAVVVARLGPIAPLGWLSREGVSGRMLGQ